jgi:hypothetical protein
MNNKNEHVKIYITVPSNGKDFFFFAFEMKQMKILHNVGKNNLLQEKLKYNNG